MKINRCSECQCETGKFTIEEDVLVLEFDCNHEIHDLVMNLNFIGEVAEDAGKLN